jgi:septum formation initiator
LVGTLVGPLQESVPLGQNTVRMTVRRWIAVGALVLVALLYYRPLKAYVDARSQLGQRQAVVHRLERQKATLERRLGSSTSVATVAREARALGYVRPGEHLFIVKNIDAWRKRLRDSLRPHGN